MRNLIKTFIKNEDGQGLTEYAILAALLVIAVIAILGALGGTMKDKFSDINNELKNAKPKK